LIKTDDEPSKIANEFEDYLNHRDRVSDITEESKKAIVSEVPVLQNDGIWLM